MHWWQRLSVRIPLLVMVLTLGPLIVFGMSAIRETERGLRAEIAHRASGTAEHAVQLAETLIRGSIEKIQIVLNTADMNPMDALERQWLMQLLQRHVPEVLSFSIIDREGNETAGASREKMFRAEELGNRRDDPLFARAMQGAVALGEVTTTASGTQRLSIALPLLDPKTQTVIGVLGGELSVRNLLEEITSMAVGDAGVVFVLDSGGNLIAHSDQSKVLAGENHADNPHFHHVMEGGEHGRELHTRVDRTGASVLTTGLKSDFLGWVFMVEQPRAQALAPVLAMQRRLGLLLALIIVLAAGTGAYFLLRLTRPLRSLQTAAERIGRGELGHTVDIASRDEMGEVASAFNAMSCSLQEASVAKTRTDWLKTGAARLNDAMRGKQVLGEVGSAVLGEMAARVEARVGALYLADPENATEALRFAAGYAFQRSESESIQPGEGLVGQAIVEKAPIVVRNVPDGYLDVASGLGDAAPLNLLIVPFVYEGRVKGVVELGILEAATDLHLEYLRQAAPAVAVALETAGGRERLSRALEKSQAAGEELQAQQEELRAVNEELEEQRRALKASEERLKMQQEELQAANEELEEKAEALERRLE